MPETDKTVQQIELLLQEAYALRGNNLNESVRLTEHALAESERLKLSELLAKSLSQLALFHMIKGNFNLSLSYSEKAIQYYEATGNELGIADAKFSIAGVHYKTDNYHLGMVNLIDSLNIYKKYQDYYNMARCYKSLGTILEYFGDQNKAIEYYENCIAKAKLAGDVNLESNAYNPLSGILIKKGKYAEAMELIEKALSMKEFSGDTRGYAFSLYGRAKVYAATGKYDLAEKDYLNALTIHKKFNEKLGIAMLYSKLGELYLKMNQFDLALETLTKAREFSYENKIMVIKYKSNYQLYLLYKKLNHSAKALEFLEAHIKEKERVVNTQTLTIIENYELINRFENMKREAEIQKEKAEILEKKKVAENLAIIKQDFLSTMSHEIRTPLNAVITIANLLEQKLTGEDNQLITSLKFAANNLLHLINDILDFTKLENGKVSLEKHPVDLFNLLQQTIKTYEELALEKGLKLKLQLPENTNNHYLTDEGRLAQIITNLIGNAIKYTNEGEVLVKLETENHHHNTDKVRISVIDTGIGIPEEMQEEIFNSFSSTHDTRTRKYGGTGLGLAIVKKLSALFQTEMKVISKLGEGSVFFFDLFLEKAKPIQQNNPTLTGGLDGKSVLLVEDNAINAMVAQKLLQKWNIKTTHVVNGLKAIEAAKENVYDMILMDIHMPEMDGFEATKWIRTHENLNQNTPILALTADVTAEGNTEYAQYFNHFLKKPIETQKLFDFLWEYMGTHT